MSKVKVGLVQMSCTANKEENLQKAIVKVKEAAAKGAQIVYEPAPVVRASVLDRHPKIKTVLEPVFASLTLETLQTLNSRIAVEGQDAKRVAVAYLKEKGFLK